MRVSNSSDCGKEQIVDELAKMLRPCAIPTSPLHHALQKAAKKSRQKTAAAGRVAQRRQDMAMRRLAVAMLFRELPDRRKKEPASLATAQALIGRLEKHFGNLKRAPQFTVRTVQEDIREMRENGNFRM